ncbi:MAG: 4'-phosphopantetheinyl transferase superfamily protein [Bacteroidales bacterium]|nr:4'-phosphopantetheinyl transferase superfamily protein [Bacteroidales bacterium]
MQNNTPPHYKLLISPVMAEDEIRQFLLPQDIKLINSITNIKSREQTATGRYLLRNYLKSVFPHSCEKLSIEKDDKDKPYIEGKSGFYFNTSHSDELVAVVISDAECGIDIEKTAKYRENIARRFYHPVEIAMLDSMEESLRTEYFYRTWTIKEAYLKYLGKGIPEEMQTFYLSEKGVLIKNGIPDQEIELHFERHIYNETPYLITVCLSVSR